MDEQKSPEATSLLELIEQVLQGTASEEQRQQLQARLLASAEDRRLYLHHLNLHSALRRRFAFDAGEETPGQRDLVSGGRASGNPSRPPKIRLARWALAAAAVVVLIATIYFQRPVVERPIAKITGLSGSLEWTGDGGRVHSDLIVGAELPGGTIEGMTPGSWFELQFIDGSTVTISGTSTLTFSDHGQKKLHLKEGNVSGDVKPQPAGKPLLIYTRSAVLEVLGTQFEVEAAPAATTLNVSKGTVRIKRLSDGATVLVPARHRATAAADCELSAVPLPASVNHWRSQLNRGPDRTLGKWMPPTGQRGASIGAIPYVTEQGKTIFALGFGVSCGDRPPVRLDPGARLRVRGRMASSHPVFFGVTLRRENGEFAGKFQTTRPAAEFAAGQSFEALLDLGTFRLDPSLEVWKDRLPSVPFHLVVESVWCHTLYEPAGLEITEVELLPPGASAVSQSPATEPQQAPVMDIWTATARGNLEAAKSLLAAGAPIDATLIAPGVPASGATPLHLAVLADQGEIAQFLIQKGANLNAKAKDEHGGTPLHWAAALGRFEMARLLIDAGSEVNSEDDNGFTPLDATAYDPHSQKEAKLRIATLLQEKGGRTAEKQPPPASPQRGDQQRRDIQPARDSE